MQMGAVATQREEKSLLDRRFNNLPVKLIKGAMGAAQEITRALAAKAGLSFIKAEIDLLEKLANGDKGP